MPLPTPRDGEADKEFISRCMGDEVVKSDYGAGSKQAVAVCYSQLRRSKRSSSATSANPDGEVEIVEDPATEIEPDTDEEPAPGACCEACASKTGSCEGSSDDDLAFIASEAVSSNVEYFEETLRANGPTVIERTDANGDKILEFPIVMMIEGVRQAANSPQPELLLREAFEGAIKSLEAPPFRGRLPLVFTHPRRGQAFVSVHDRHDLSTGIPLGYIDGLKFDDSNKLIGRAHLYRHLADAAGQDAVTQYDTIRGGRMVEVSVGHAAKILPYGGIFQGKRFFGIHASPRFDHLAILGPKQTGACSIKDGCGGPRTYEAGNGFTESMLPEFIAELGKRGIEIDVSFAAYSLPSRFSGVFALASGNQTLGLGNSDPVGLKHHDGGSTFAVVFENRANGRSVVLGQRFTRLSEAKFAARERLARLKNTDIVAHVARKLGSADIQGHGRRPIYKAITSMTVRIHAPRR